MNEREREELGIRVATTVVVLLTLAVVVPLVIYREDRLEDSGLDLVVWLIMGGAGGVLGGNLQYGIQRMLKRRRRL